MSGLPRRTLDDLKMRYELEPSLDDLYVEGYFDKEVIDRVFLKHNQQNRIVYEIDSVDVPDDLIQIHDLSTGNKQRVMVLARVLAEINEECNYVCLVDRDLDHWFGELEKTNRLAWTEHTSLELYFLSENFLKEVLCVAAKCKFNNWAEFYASFIQVLKSLYVLRLVDRDIGLKLKWVKLEKSLSVLKSSIVFDREGYVTKLLSANSKLAVKDEFQCKIESWNAQLIGDCRAFIRGHDLVFLMSWVVGNFKGLKDFHSEDAIMRFFVLLSHNAEAVINSLDPQFEKS